MSQNFEIVYLVDAPELISQLAAMFIEEWEPFYGRQGPGDAESALFDCCNRDQIPLARVAVNSQGEVLGTASLKARSIDTHRHLSPWLTAMYVPDGYRGQGIVVALVAEIEKDARRLGYDRLYVSSRGITSAMKKSGWSLMDEAASLRGPIEIYERDLTTR